MILQPTTSAANRRLNGLLRKIEAIFVTIFSSGMLPQQKQRRALYKKRRIRLITSLKSKKTTDFPETLLFLCVLSGFKIDSSMEEAKKYPIHLCQPDSNKSCGACCGLYNWEDHSRKTLTARLENNTRLFFSFGERPDIASYRKLQSETVAQQKLCETIYNCEFLGFINKEHTRIGCLLHPCIHHGDDLRDCSFYGAEMCAGHFCPSYTYLTVSEQAAAATVLDDWYLYGLTVTDIDFVKEFFTIVQNRLGDCLNPERFAEPAVKLACRNYFQLKESWKFASAKNRLGKYYFSRAEYHIARIDYEKNGKITPSRFDKIFLSLASEFSSEAEVAEAERIIEDKINSLVVAYRGG